MPTASNALDMCEAIAKAFLKFLVHDDQDSVKEVELSSLDQALQNQYSRLYGFIGHSDLLDA